MSKEYTIPKAHAELLVLNIGKAAAASNNYPSALRLWTGWAKDIVPAAFWNTETGADFLSQTKRNLQSMTALKNA